MKNQRFSNWKNQRFKDKKISNKIPELFADSRNQRIKICKNYKDKISKKLKMKAWKDENL